METIYCLVPAAYWRNYAGKTEYIPRDYDEEGFIHATKGDDLLVKVANRVYRDFTGELLVLVIDESRVAAEIKYERAKDGLLYPHIYGALNQDAIIQIRRMDKAGDGWRLGDGG
jgi:uncharacterized protein (DUF952 family)